jgi:hypothetical protein
VGGSFCPELGFADWFGWFLWHPASSIVGITKKKPHEKTGTNSSLVKN